MTRQFYPNAPVQRSRPVFRATLPLISLLAMAVLATLVFAPSLSAQVIISGNDNQALIVDGKLQIDKKGQRTISIIDISGEKPFIKANLPIGNSIFGPPTNIAISPFEGIALVAEAVELNAAGDGFQPTNRIHVIDLNSRPPKKIDTIEAGKQPSGMSIHPKGQFALVANRAETSISILSIRGDKVKHVGKVETEHQVTHIVFSPEGDMALATKFTTHQVAILKIDGEKVTYTGINIPVGLWPYNADITPDGKLALVANTGNSGRSDGNPDTVTVIDLEAQPPHVIDHVVVGDAPEGIAISPRGDIAVTGNLGGSDAPPDAPYYRPRGSITILDISGKSVTRQRDLVLGGVPEAIAFAPDGKRLYVANLNDSNITVLKVEGNWITAAGITIDLPGHPGSLRSRTRLAP